MLRINCKKLLSLAIVLIAIFSVGWSQGLPLSIGQVTGTASTTARTGRPDYPSWRKSLDRVHTPNRGCFKISYPNTVWQSTGCVTGPSVPLGPMAPSSAGNGYDDVAYSGSGSVIGSSSGSFPSTTGLTSEVDSQAGPNYYGLQINSQFFTTNTPYTGNRVTTAWEQFVFINDPGYDSGFIYIQYWLIDYESSYGTCPTLDPPGGTAWMAYAGSCYANSISTSVPSEPASGLANLVLKGYANLDSNDENMICISGSCYSVSPTYQVLDLYQNWQYSEFNVFGYCCASTANFNSGTTLTVANALENANGNAITSVCENSGYTGETNNLNLGACSTNAASGEILFTESNGASVNPQVSVGPPSVVQGQSVSYTGSGFTPNGGVTVVIDSGSGFAYIVGTLTASASGTISGSFVAGTNILPGVRQVTFTDSDTGLSVAADVTVVQLTSSVTMTTTTTTASTLTSSTSTYRTTTTTTGTSTSTSTVGQACTATSTTQSTSIIVEGSSSTSTTTATTSVTSTYVTATSSTSTATLLTTTTTTTTLCTLTSTSTATSTALTTFSRPSTSITLTSSLASVALGSGVTLAGTISPNPGSVPVTLSFSFDSGAWTPFLTIMTGSLGSYSIEWVPPATGNYMLNANWDGNGQLASTQSSPMPLTVTGVTLAGPSVILSAPSTTPHGQTVLLPFTVINSGTSALNVSVAVEVTGPNGYVAFNVTQIEVAPNSQTTGYYNWAVPNQTGTFTIMLNFLPPESGGDDIETIQVV